MAFTRLVPYYPPYPSSAGMPSFSAVVPLRVAGVSRLCAALRPGAQEGLRAAGAPSAICCPLRLQPTRLGAVLPLYLPHAPLPYLSSARHARYPWPGLLPRVEMTDATAFPPRSRGPPPECAKKQKHCPVIEVTGSTVVEARPGLRDGDVPRADRVLRLTSATFVP